MQNENNIAPESTAVRVALWRAMHMQVDLPPYIFEDDIGLKLANPDKNWRERPDMDIETTKLFRASIIARARFIEDLLLEEIDRGVNQYIIIGAGLDSFAQRKKEIASRLQIFEIDQPGPQQWKSKRLVELGFGIPNWLHFVSVNFESGINWLEKLSSSHFDIKKPTFVSSTGVSMYLSKDAVFRMLQEIATLAPGSKLAMSFLLPFKSAEPAEKSVRQAAEAGAKASGTPFGSFFSSEDILALAKEAGFRETNYVSAASLGERYFQNRKDSLSLGNSEALLVATT